MVKIPGVRVELLLWDLSVSGAFRDLSFSYAAFPCNYGKLGKQLSGVRLWVITGIWWRKFKWSL